MKLNWTSISNISSLLTIISCVSTYLFGFISPKILKKISRKWKRYKALMEKDSACILIIYSNESSNISGDVERFRNEQKNLKRIPNKHLFKLCLVSGERSLNKNDSHKIKQKLNKVLSEISNQGLGTIHLFCLSPIAISTIIGATMSNRYQIFTYQKQKATYELWGDLTKY